MTNPSTDHDCASDLLRWTHKFEEDVRRLYRLAIKDLPPEDIGVFIFGSPARREMVPESDADILLVRTRDTPAYRRFRERFVELLKQEHFPKLDCPNWGTLDDCETYIKHSITEGNQVAEARFLIGDSTLEEKMNHLKTTYQTPERLERVLLFQKLYFDQYYTQRTRTGVLNVKYGAGGTRDLLFVSWLAELLEGHFNNDEPDYIAAINTLHRLDIIDNHQEHISAANTVVMLRNNILKANADTGQKGLTYLDDDTVGRLIAKRMYLRSPSLRDDLYSAIESVATLKETVWQAFLQHLNKKYGAEHHRRLVHALEGKHVTSSDTLIATAAAWRTPTIDNDAFSGESRWDVLCSLACRPDCPPETLDMIATEGTRKGFEYLLRVLARNANTSKSTLERIATHPLLEERFKTVAACALHYGVGRANELR